MTDKAEAPVVRKTAKEVAAVPLEAEPIVKARVTKMGGDKISTGQHLPQLGDELYAFGEVIELQKSNAEALEARGFVEIQ